MGLFDKRKKDAGSSAQLQNESSIHSLYPDINGTYEKAMSLLNSPSRETQQSGREMMTDLAWSSFCRDPRVFLWMAKEYEANGCPSTASDWYKRASLCGAKEGQEGFIRCYNPYHIDEYYSITGVRGCGTPHVEYYEEMREKQKEAFEEADRAISRHASREDIEKSIHTMQLLASAKNGYPPAMQWMGDYCETVEKNLPEAATWFKKAADEGNAEGSRCYADMLMRGYGVSQNVQEAKKYYLSAADKGHSEAQFIVGQMFLSERKIEEAKKYLEQASKNGYAQATQLLKKLGSSAQGGNSSPHNPLDGGSKRKIQNEQAFYTECIDIFHDEAMVNGVAMKGLIFIPELMPYGEKAVLSFLNDPYYMSMCNGDATTYYFLIMALCIETGIAFAAKWHYNFDGLPQYSEQILEECSCTVRKQATENKR